MQQFIFVIIIILFYLNNCFSNELPVVSYTKQPELKLKSENTATIVKFKKEEKFQEKITEKPMENISTTSNFRRSYRSCTSLG